MPLPGNIGNSFWSVGQPVLPYGMSDSKFAMNGKETIRLEESTIVQRPAGDCYATWRDFKNLPKFMSILKAVEILDEKRSRWTTNAPLGLDISWEAEIINESPGELIAWQTVEDADVCSAGSVRFSALDADKTKVKITAEYQPPGGRIGMALAALLMDDPERRVRADLFQFKELMETAATPD